MKPMLATLIEKPFDDSDWIFEIKWDGYRALAHKEKKVKLVSRNDKLFNARYPEIVKELESLPGTFVLDGEIVILDEKGRSHFQLLQNYGETHEGHPFYYLFDILSYQGKDIRHLPLLERKGILRQLLAKKKCKYLQYSDHIEKRGKALFNRAKKAHLEGIIAKRKASSYTSTRSKDWLKIKTKRRQEVVIGGFTAPRNSRKYFGSLLVGVYEKGKLVYSGHVGGGFNAQLLKSTYAQLRKHICKKCPFVDEPKANGAVTWVHPQLVCEVAFAEWTRANIMRQPIFQGMRIDKPAKKITREST